MALTTGRVQKDISNRNRIETKYWPKAPAAAAILRLRHVSEVIVIKMLAHFSSVKRNGLWNARSALVY